MARSTTCGSMGARSRRARSPRSPHSDYFTISQWPFTHADCLPAHGDASHALGHIWTWIVLLRATHLSQSHASSVRQSESRLHAKISDGFTRGLGSAWQAVASTISTRTERIGRSLHNADVPAGKAAHSSECMVSWVGEKSHFASGECRARLDPRCGG